MPHASPFAPASGHAPMSARQAFAPVLLLTSIFFVNFVTRVVLSPLLPVIKEQLGLSHTDSGGLFFIVSAGITLSMLSSSFLAARLPHRTVVLASACIMGVGFCGAGLMPGAGGLRVCLFITGLGAGLYLPSAIASITGAVAKRDWGKLFAVHELAPNISFIVAPLLAEAFLPLVGWRPILVGVGCLHFVVAVVFWLFGSIGRFRGQMPRRELAARVVASPAFWVLGGWFALAVGASLGAFAMLPLYLTESGMARTDANLLVTVARVGALFMALGTGYVLDRFGARRLLVGFFVCMGVLTAAIGVAPYLPVTVTGALVTAQMLVSVCYFPAGFVILGRIFPADVRNMAVSFLIPMAAIFGAGLTPVLIGVAGDAGGFHWAFVAMGVLLLCGLLGMGRVDREMARVVQEESADEAAGTSEANRAT